MGYCHQGVWYRGSCGLFFDSLVMDERRLIDWLTELRFYISVNTTYFILESLFQAIVLISFFSSTTRLPLCESPWLSYASVFFFLISLFVIRFSRWLVVHLNCRHVGASDWSWHRSQFSHPLQLDRAVCRRRNIYHQRAYGRDQPDPVTWPRPVTRPTGVELQRSRPRWAGCIPAVSDRLCWGQSSAEGHQRQCAGLWS